MLHSLKSVLFFDNRGEMKTFFLKMKFFDTHLKKPAAQVFISIIFICIDFDTKEAKSVCVNSLSLSLCAVMHLR